MADIASKVAQIRQSTYGAEVRESIASGLETMNTEVEDTTKRQDTIDANESARVNAENQRNTNESVRNANEGNRVSAESTRVAEFDQIKSDYNTASKFNVVTYRDWSYTASQDTSIFTIDLGIFNPLLDIAELSQDGILLSENDNYARDGAEITLSYTLSAGEKIDVRVFKGVINDPPSSDGSNLMDGSISKIKLSADVVTRIDSLDIRGRLITQFPIIAPESDDTGRFQRALDSGFNLILEHGGNYTLHNTYISKSNLLIDGNNSRIVARSKDSNIFILGSDSNNNFVKVTDIEIKNIDFEGVNVDITENYTSSAINVKNNLLQRGSGVENVKVHHCKFKKFTIDIISTGSTTFNVYRNLFSNNVYNQSVSAGGYGVLIQACFDTWIKNNIFTASDKDRHAIYISNVPGQNVQNENVWIRDNIADWTQINPITGFETCMMIRSCKVLKILNNNMYGGYGGITIEISNGDSEDYLIQGNTAKGVTAKNNELACVAFIASSAYKLNGLKILDNKLNAVNNNAFGISVGGDNLSNVDIFGNEVDAPIFGITVGTVNGLKIGENTFLNCSSSAIRYSGTITNAEIYPNTFRGTGYKENSIDTIAKDIKHKYTRFAQIGSDASGNVSVSEDLSNMISSLTSQWYGVDIMFKPHCKPIQGDLIAQLMGSNGLYFYNRGLAGTNGLALGIKTFSGSDCAYGSISMPIRLLVMQ